MYYMASVGAALTDTASTSAAPLSISAPAPLFSSDWKNGNDMKYNCIYIIYIINNIP